MTSEKEQFYIQRISELEAQLKQRDERIAALEKQVAELLKVNDGNRNLGTPYLFLLCLGLLVGRFFA